MGGALIAEDIPTSPTVVLPSIDRVEPFLAIMTQLDSIITATHPRPRALNRVKTAFNQR